VASSLVKLVSSRLAQRASASNNAGFPDASPGSSIPAWGVDAGEAGKLKSIAGPVRGLPPQIFKESGMNVRILGFQQHPVVQACMRVITDVACTVPLRTYRDVDGKVEAPLINKLQKLLDAPSSSSTARQLRAAFALDFITYGNAFWRMVRLSPGGPVAALKRINPEGMQVVYVDQEQNVIAYMWIDHFGRVRTTAGEDIVHFRDLQLAPSWLPDVFGFPRVATALNSIAGDTEATKYVRQIVTNDGTPTLAFIMADQVGQADAETAQERWQQLNVERGRRGRAAFVGGVKDVKAIGFNLKDLEFPDLRRVSREDICAAIGVDPRMIGISSAIKDSGLSGSQYAEARSRLISHTVEPLLAVEEDALNASLSPEYGLMWIKYHRKTLQELVEDDKATSDRVTTEFIRGARSWEETREALHLDPTIKPTDTVWLPNTGQMVLASSVVIDLDEEDETPDPTAGTVTAVPKPGDPAGAAPVAAAKPEAEPAPEKNDKTPLKPDRSISHLTRSRLAKGIRLIERGVKLTTGQRQLLWSAFDSRATKEEAEYKRAALRRFGDEKESVRKIFDKQKAEADAHRSIETRDSADDALSSDDPYIQAALNAIKRGYKQDAEYYKNWINEFRALIGKTYTVAGQELLDELGLDFNLDNPAVYQAIQDRVEQLASYVTETSAKQVAAAVTVGRKAGMGIGDVAKLVDQTVFGGTAISRATMIARTETVGALNQGEHDTAKAQGVMQSKEWLTQQDDKVRDSHAELDGVRIDMDDIFDNGCAYPGDQNGDADEVINCRCTLLFYDEKAE
jgi:HK97 family phage portal protein